MPSWLTDVLKLLGFTTPFVYAAATYWFFHWLDKKASSQAKRAISGWFRPLTYDKVAVAEALVEIFDRLYSQRLLSIRAFCRSAAITIAVTVAVSMFVMIVQSTTYKLPRLISGGSLAIGWLSVMLGFAANVISDYLSLFVVRYCLRAAGWRPIRALLFAALSGAAVILIVYFAKSVMWVLTAPPLVLVGNYGSGQRNVWVVLGSASAEIWGELGRFATHGMLWSAMAVHLWLPLFALGVLGMQAVNSFVWAVGKMQWFLARGRDHPLQAIGYVAAIIVFAITGGAQLVWR